MCPCLLFFGKKQQKSKVPAFLIRKFFLKIFKEKKKRKVKDPYLCFLEKNKQKIMWSPLCFSKKVLFSQNFLFLKNKGGPHDYPKKLSQNEWRFT